MVVADIYTIKSYISLNHDFMTFQNSHGHHVQIKETTKKYSNSMKCSKHIIKKGSPFEKNRCKCRQLVNSMENKNVMFNH